jgi:hypothetical protein
VHGRRLAQTERVGLPGEIGPVIWSRYLNARYWVRAGWRLGRKASSQGIPGGAGLSGRALKFLAAELYVYRGKVVLELIGALGADEDRSDGRLM